MKFNLAVTAIAVVAALATVGQPLADAANQGTKVTLLVYIAFALAVMVWRLLNLSQEPAVFLAMTYLSFVAVTAIAYAVSGDYTRAVIGVVVSPILAVCIVEDQRTRRWINRVARYPAKNLHDDRSGSRNVQDV
ncbi:hypothetical protein BFN03_16235 [Rhodococcus sp. WMMA185]|uniref:hypothetical protein n=1 Tax=Rhodococcus sp. WMMA185 TaxID=679318 RepID=UPI000878726E|nr:hypothetical protein [Rhodococcus sp. WMMA185]AOW93673.1 hypothetical protein BFN03_16235 [Rhodococcus sp. WMMA185]